MRWPRHLIGVLEDEALQAADVLLQQVDAGRVAIDDLLREPVAAQGLGDVAILVPRLALPLDRLVVLVAEADRARGRKGGSAHRRAISMRTISTHSALTFSRSGRTGSTDVS